MKKRTRIAGFVLSSACGLVACSAEDTPDGSVRGELRVANVSYLDGHSEREFYLAPEGSDELTRLVFPQNPEIPALTPLKVWGALEGENFLVERFEVDEKKSAALVAEAPEPLLNGTKRTRTVGFVLMDIGSGVDLTVAQAQTAAFGTRGANNAALREYYLEASYNTLEFTGQVFETDVALPSGCSTSQLLNIANNWDTEFGVTLDHWMGYIGSNASACGWGGVGWEGNAQRAQAVSFYNSSDSCVVLAQEIGHNLGWMHNGTMDCGNDIMPNDPASCSGNEYGSRISPMGGACLHLNAYDKWYQGFFGQCNGVRIPGSGTFTLLPIEIPCDGVQGLSIPMPMTRSFRNSSGGNAVSISRYYLELRTKRGLDNKSAIPGPRVFVHVGPDMPAANRSSTFNWVLDMDPTTSGFDGMNVGQTFTDPAGGVSFTVTAMDNDRATITVNNTSGSGSPTCMDGTTFSAPGPTSCGTPTGGMGGMAGMAGMAGMGGTPGGGTGGMAGAGRGGMAGGGMGGIGGMAGGGVGGATTAGQGGIAGLGGAPGGAAGAAGLAGAGGSGIAGFGGASGAGSGGAPIAGSAGVGIAGASGTGASGMAGAAAGGPVAGAAGAGPGPGSGPPAPQAVGEDPGCGCRTIPANRASTAWWALSLFGLGLLRRRRARRV